MDVFQWKNSAESLVVFLVSIDLCFRHITVADPICHIDLHVLCVEWMDHTAHSLHRGFKTYTQLLIYQVLGKAPGF